jgi:RNA polymerase sigma-70 factor (ECF subfamily)
MTVIREMDTREQDATAIAAVRRGDPERYRELVERHERRVFAVAWARLGDSALAEEAAQEAFIRAYRQLPLLRDGAKFAGWIAAITRRVAINLGLRHRRELNKRARWALENRGGATEPETASPALEVPLRETLSALPAAHRECLVLFYLEGKGGAEAAAALGLSESAFRVRLHRARHALRRQLEENLEESLEHLRPRDSIASSAMPAILVLSSAKGASSATAESWRKSCP